MLGTQARRHFAASYTLSAVFCCVIAVGESMSGGGLSSRSSREIVFENRCKETVWVGSQGSPAAVGGGGWAVGAGKREAVKVEEGWHGRFWGRTGCRFNREGKGRCETGDCSGMAQCAGAGGMPPTTLAEFAFGEPNDFYDVSLVDGFNIPVTITPGSRQCRAAACAADLNPVCPAPLRVVVKGGGGRRRRRRRNGEEEEVVVACRSACNAFGRPEYCCTGPFASPASCRASLYSRLFKRACPHAYTYAFDDPTSTFTCAAPPTYLITFC